MHVTQYFKHSKFLIKSVLEKFLDTSNIDFYFKSYLSTFFAYKETVYILKKLNQIVHVMTQNCTFAGNLLLFEHVWCFEALDSTKLFQFQWSNFTAVSWLAQQIICAISF